MMLILMLVLMLMLMLGSLKRGKNWGRECLLYYCFARASWALRVLPGPGVRLAVAQEPGG
jgi:hypothetical protein